jgi:hypothetical protein
VCTKPEGDPAEVFEASVDRFVGVVRGAVEGEPGQDVVKASVHPHINLDAFEDL